MGLKALKKAIASVADVFKPTLKAAGYPDQQLLVLMVLPYGNEVAKGNPISTPYFAQNTNVTFDDYDDSKLRVSFINFEEYLAFINKFEKSVEIQTNYNYSKSLYSTI